MARRPNPVPNDSPRRQMSARPQEVLSALAETLQPFIELLLASGIDYPQFASYLKPLFIEQAKRELQRMHLGLTDSSLSVLSGVHRKDVKNWRENKLFSSKSNQVSISAQIFATWVQHPEYRDRKKQPKPLRRTGEAPSFDALVRLVTQDIHPFTILQDLIRLNLVQVEIRKNVEIVVPRLEGFIPPPGSKEALQLMASNVSDHAKAAVSNLLGARPTLEQSVFASGITKDSAELLSKLARQLWENARAEMIAEATKLYEADRLDGDANHRVRFGSYFFSENLDLSSSGKETGEA